MEVVLLIVFAVLCYLLWHKILVERGQPGLPLAQEFFQQLDEIAGTHWTPGQQQPPPIVQAMPKAPVVPAVKAAPKPAAAPMIRPPMPKPIVTPVVEPPPPPPAAPPKIDVPVAPVQPEAKPPPMFAPEPVVDIPVQVEAPPMPKVEQGPPDAEHGPRRDRATGGDSTESRDRKSVV